MLVIHANRVVSTDRLAEALWEEDHPPSATNTLQGYVSQLRNALATIGSGRTDDALIRTQSPGYVLSVDPERIDARRFERLLAEGRQAMLASDPEEAASAFDEALSLWQGPALADLPDRTFASVEAARLEELRLAAIEEQAEAELALGRHAELVGRLQALVAEHPLRERLWGQLMVALYRNGRQAEALRAYQAARQLLAEELGIDPGPDLRRLEADILAHAPSLRWAAHPADTGAHHGDQRKASGLPRGATRPEQVPFPRSLSSGPVLDYVGREELLRKLAQARQQAFDGTTRAVLLAGEPGIGKTRTVGDVAQEAFADGALVLYGHCDEDFAVPYQPFVEALDWYTAHSPDPVLGRHPAELTRLQPLLPSRVPNLGTPVSSDPRSEEFLLFEATSSWLIELARRHPVVLVLDDLHWASKPVLLLLRHLVRKAAADVGGVPMLLLGTYRDTEVGADHPLADLLADLRRLDTTERMAVLRLSPTEVEEFVALAVGRELDEPTARLAEVLYAETEGNPFFLHEVLRHLAETGAVRADDARVSTVAGTLTVPERVRDVVSGRVRRLPPRAREVLSLAAVVGVDFDAALLAELSDLSESGLLDAVDESIAAGLVEETGPDRYRFSHALVRATLLEELSATRRRRLHGRIAEVIEKLRPEDLVGLAHHFAEAGPNHRDRSRAVEYGLAAAEQALGARALADAEARFRRVLTLSAESPDAEPAQVARAMCGLGEAQRDQGAPEYRSALLEAARLAQDCGNGALLVRAALSNSRGLPSVIGGLDAERVAVTESALVALGPGISAERALLLAQLAAETTFMRDDRRRLDLADEAEAMARALGDLAALAEVLNRTGYAVFSARRVERLVARGAEATRLSDATGDPSQRVLSRYFWSGALLTAGDIGAFRRVTQEMPVVAQEAAPTLQWLALATQARLRLIDGDSAGVQRINDQAFQMAQELGEPDGRAWWAAILCPLEWHRGAMWRHADLLRSGIEQYPDEQAWRIGYALALATRGQGEEAREALRPDPPRIEQLIDHVFPFFNLQMMAYIAYHLDDSDMAAHAAAALRPYRWCWAHQHAATAGPVSIALALCAAATGDLDRAVAGCEETDRLLEDLGCWGLLPLLRIYYAEVLYRRARAGDRVRAEGLLDDVCRRAEALEAPDLAEWAHRLRHG